MCVWLSNNKVVGQVCILLFLIPARSTVGMLVSRAFLCNKIMPMKVWLGLFSFAYNFSFFLAIWREKEFRTNNLETWIDTRTHQVTNSPFLAWDPKAKGSYKIILQQSKKGSKPLLATSKTHIFVGCYSLMISSHWKLCSSCSSNESHCLILW